MYIPGDMIDGLFRWLRAAKGNPLNWIIHRCIRALYRQQIVCNFSSDDDDTTRIDKLSELKEHEQNGRMCEHNLSSRQDKCAQIYSNIYGDDAVGQQVICSTNINSI